MQKFVFLFNLNPIFHHSTLLKIFNRPCTSQKTVLELKLVFSSKKKNQITLFKLAGMLKTI